MAILQLTYASRPFGFDSASLAGILLDARRCNARDGITGALICRDDLYLQLLEGPAGAVEAAYKRIAGDDRHIELRPLMRRKVDDTARLFPNWSMRDDPAQSWVWTRAEVEDGVPERATEHEVAALFERWASTAT